MSADTGAVVGTVSRILALKKLPMLGSLPAASLAVLAEHARERLFRKGEVLLREGEAIGAVYFVVEGIVHISRKGKAIGHAGPGSPVGGLGVLARDIEGVEAYAEAETLALELDVDDLLEIFEDNFPILHHVMRETCRQMLDVLALTPTGQAPRLPRIETGAMPARELDLVERIFFVRRAEAFANSSINALAELSRGLTEVRFDPDVTLWAEGDPSGGVLLVVNGVVGCSTARRGPWFRAGPGVPLGIVESVAERPRWFAAVTETKVVALHGDIEGVIDVFEDNFEMGLDYLAVISRALLRLLESGAGGQLDRFYGCEGAPPGCT